MDVLRLLGAGCFVYAGLVAGGLLLSRVADPGNPLAIATMVALIVLLLVAALALFNLGVNRSAAPMESIRELEEKGLVLDQSFTARRAFQAEELEDEGSHYFVELTDGTVLYLSGQYLYDYEPIEDDEPRRFPCTEFTIRRHREQQEVVLDIVCGGDVLEPEVVAQPFDEDDDVPEDGQILAIPYETLKARESSRR